LAGPIIPNSKGFIGGFLNRNNPFSPVRFVPEKTRSFLQRLNNYFFPDHSLQSGYIKSAGNGNLSLRITGISQISGYKVNLSNGGEDEDICERIRKEFGSESIYFDESLRVTHDSKDSLSSALQRSYRYGRTSANSWLRSGGIPTFLPLPFIFTSFLFLFISRAPWTGTIGFLVSYTIVVSRGKSCNKFIFVLYNFIDSYIRLILEFAHNFGFIMSYTLGKVTAIKIDNYLLSLRKKEASTVLVNTI
jgi:hypothetical protein